MINITFNKIIEKLNSFWRKQNCIIMQPIDTEVGAATFHPTTFINALNNKEWNAAYTQITKRPGDMQLNEISNRSTIFHQYQVIMKPSPINIQELYLKSLNYIGINIKKNEIKFIEDNWQSPTLGAFGIGWEVRLNGIEITQFTYFQQVGSIECKPIMVELAYGLERISMHMQNIKNINNIVIDIIKSKKITYSEILSNYKTQLDKYIKNEITLENIVKEFNNTEKKCEHLIKKNLPLIAYDYVMKLSNIFNLIDSKISIASVERQDYIIRLKNLTKKIAIKIKNEKK